MVHSNYYVLDPLVDSTYNIYDGNISSLDSYVYHMYLPANYDKQHLDDIQIV